MARGNEKWPNKFITCGYMAGCTSLKFAKSKMCDRCWEIVRRKRDAQKQRRRNARASCGQKIPAPQIVD